MKSSVMVNGYGLRVKGYWLLVIVFLLSPLTSHRSPLFAQNDSVLNRSVTVERDFQPVIQAAGKVATRPAVTEMQLEPAKIEYSDFIAEVAPGTSFNPLLSQPTRFVNNEPYHGYVRGALGHKNTLFDFGYHLDDGKHSILDVYAHHRAGWGLRALSKTTLGLNFTHPFSRCDLYFGINGGNVFYHKYGHYYDYSLAAPSAWIADKVAYPNADFSAAQDKTSLWTAEAYIGVKANAKQDVQYRVQTGYKLFSKPGAVNEHQIRTHADFDWHSNAHHVGAQVYVQNNLLQLGSLAAVIPDSLYRSRHNFRIEPYYEYRGNRINLHVGVNLDLNLGRGQNSLSGIENLSFAPSPHIMLEGQVAPKWLTIYTDITGSHGLGTLQAYMEENRYRIIHAGIIEPHCAEYTPIDAELGLHIRPHRDLLIELHGGYAYMMNQDVWIATANIAAFSITPASAIVVNPGDFTYFHTNYQRGKIGGQLNYHYQDIVRINLNGDYYFWSGDTIVFDRPNWELGLRIDGRIDKHWSLYSDNHFAGSRLALATDGVHTLKPTIDLNLGLQYEMWVGRKAKTEKLTVKGGGEQILSPEPQPNLTLFLQLNNWLHRKNDIYYGYNSEGINFLLGATFRF